MDGLGSIFILFCVSSLAAIFGKFAGNATQWFEIGFVFVIIILVIIKFGISPLFNTYR